MCAQPLQWSPTLCDTVVCNRPSSSVHGDSPGKNSAESCHALLQGIFPTQGSNLHLLSLLHCRQILDPLSHLYLSENKHKLVMQALHTEGSIDVTDAVNQGRVQQSGGDGLHSAI